ncbi:bactofilin family protein [Croceiramulus getboli]|nr:polymer-forming cytoskeletal protein [Flavobacteriaceae bacterium YJPT1-3]
MFSDNKKARVGEPTNSQNRIAEGTKIVGDITSQGGFRIDGTIEGNINTPGKVVVGQAGKVNGTINCENADIEGSIKGTLNIKDLLSLKSSAHIEGDVNTKKLAVEPGASFNASCTMGSSATSKGISAPSADRPMTSPTASKKINDPQGAEKTA